jgi:pyruvate/2-oxoglutarate dehydrogenase complex dihydrolipoamide acyltransferase (E2) component
MSLSGVLTAADDPAKSQDEPPVRLKKKIKPEQSAQPPEKKQQPSTDKKAEPGKKTAKDEEEPEVDPKELEEKIKELMTRVGKNMREAETRLSNKDAGSATQDVERDIVKDLEELIQQTQRQQQQQQAQQKQRQQAEQNGSMTPQQRLQQRLRQARANRERRRKMARQQNSVAPQQSEQPAGTNPLGGNAPAGEMSKIADLYKDIWGHLPEMLRQEMNQYAREQFMPKYNELLKQYYATIAEKGRSKRDGN